MDEITAQLEEMKQKLQAAGYDDSKINAYLDKKKKELFNAQTEKKKEAKKLEQREDNFNAVTAPNADLIREKDLEIRNDKRKQFDSFKGATGVSVYQQLGEKGYKEYLDYLKYGKVKSDTDLLGEFYRQEKDINERVYMENLQDNNPKAYEARQEVVESSKKQNAELEARKKELDDSLEANYSTFQKDVNDLTKLQNEIRGYQSRFEEIPQEIIDRYTALSEDVSGKVEGFTEISDEYTNILGELGSNNDAINAFKRTYSNWDQIGHAFATLKDDIDLMITQTKASALNLTQQGANFISKIATNTTPFDEQLGEKAYALDLLVDKNQVKKNREYAAEKLPTALQIGDIRSFEDFGYWAADSINNNAPSMALTAATMALSFVPGVGAMAFNLATPAFFAMGAAPKNTEITLSKEVAEQRLPEVLERLKTAKGPEKYGLLHLKEQYEKAIDVSDVKRLTTLFGHGSAEVIWERAFGSLRFMKSLRETAKFGKAGTKKGIRKALEAVPSKLPKSAKDLLRHGGRYGKTALKGITEESISEAMTTIQQNWFDINVLGEDKKLMDHVPEAAAQGALMGVFMGGAGQVAMDVANTFIPSYEKKKLDQTLLDISQDLHEIENNPSLSLEEQIVIADRVQKKVNGTLAMGENDAKRIRDLSYNEIIAVQNATIEIDNLKKERSDIRKKRRLHFTDADQARVDELSNQIEILEKGKDEILDRGFSGEEMLVINNPQMKISGITTETLLEKAGLQKQLLVNSLVSINQAQQRDDVPAGFFDSEKARILEKLENNAKIGAKLEKAYIAETLERESKESTVEEVQGKQPVSKSAKVEGAKAPKEAVEASKPKQEAKPKKKTPKKKIDKRSPVEKILDEYTLGVDEAGNLNIDFKESGVAPIAFIESEGNALDKMYAITGNKRSLFDHINSVGKLLTRASKSEGIGSGQVAAAGPAVVAQGLEKVANKILKDVGKFLSEWKQEGGLQDALQKEVELRYTEHSGEIASDPTASKKKSENVNKLVKMITQLLTSPEAMAEKGIKIKSRDSVKVRQAKLGEHARGLKIRQLQEKSRRRFEKIRKNNIEKADKTLERELASSNGVVTPLAEKQLRIIEKQEDAVFEELPFEDMIDDQLLIFDREIKQRDTILPANLFEEIAREDVNGTHAWSAIRDLADVLKENGIDRKLTDNDEMNKLVFEMPENNQFVTDQFTKMQEIFAYHKSPADVDITDGVVTITRYKKNIGREFFKNLREYGGNVGPNALKILKNFDFDVERVGESMVKTFAFLDPFTPIVAPLSSIAKNFIVRKDSELYTQGDIDAVLNKEDGFEGEEQHVYERLSSAKASAKANNFYAMAFEVIPHLKESTSPVKKITKAHLNKENVEGLSESEMSSAAKYADLLRQMGILTQEGSKWVLNEVRAKDEFPNIYGKPRSEVNAEDKANIEKYERVTNKIEELEKSKLQAAATYIDYLAENGIIKLQRARGGKRNLYYDVRSAKLRELVSALGKNKTQVKTTSFLQGKKIPEYQGKTNWSRNKQLKGVANTPSEWSAMNPEDNPGVYEPINNLQNQGIKLNKEWIELAKQLVQTSNLAIPNAEDLVPEYVTVERRNQLIEDNTKKLDSKRNERVVLLEEADNNVDKDAVYIFHFRGPRGRFYASATLSQQGDKLGANMIGFAKEGPDGKPIDFKVENEGIKFLKAVTVAHSGQGKSADVDTMVQYFDIKKGEWFGLIDDYLSDNPAVKAAAIEKLSEFDDALEFTRTLLELYNIYFNPDKIRPENYEANVVTEIDAHASGIQMFSGLTMNETGFDITNMTGLDKSDAYNRIGGELLKAISSVETNVEDIQSLLENEDFSNLLQGIEDTENGTYLSEQEKKDRNQAYKDWEKAIEEGRTEDAKGFRKIYDDLTDKRDNGAMDALLDFMDESEDFAKGVMAFWNQPEIVKKMRKIAKTPTMTKYYSAGVMTMGKSLMTEFDPTTSIDNSVFKGLNIAFTLWLAKMFDAAAEAMLPDISALMERLQEVVEDLARQGKSFKITGLDGFKYDNLSMYSNKFPGQVSVYSQRGLEDYNAESPKDYERIQRSILIGKGFSSMSIRKMKTKIAPDIAHFFDSQIMSEVIKRAKEANIPFLALHDAFLSLPKYNKKLNQIVRDAYVKVFSPSSWGGKLPIQAIFEQNLGEKEAYMSLLGIVDEQYLVAPGDGKTEIVLDNGETITSEPTIATPLLDELADPEKSPHFLSPAKGSTDNAKGRAEDEATKKEIEDFYNNKQSVEDQAKVLQGIRDRIDLCNS